MSSRTAPQINNLKDLQQFIKIIAFEKIPYTSIEGKNLEKLSDSIKQKILNWKNDNNFSNTDSYFQELSGLTNTIEITKTESLDDADLEDFFSTTDIKIKNITEGKKKSILKLTKIGYKSFELLDSKTPQDLLEYKMLLFWAILRSNIRPVWQRLIQNMDIFSITPIDDAIKNIGENDRITRTFFLNASNYFELFNNNIVNNTGVVFDRLKIGMILLCSSILEINHSFTKGETYTIEDIVSTLEKKFQIFQSVNFLNILKTIFEIDREQSEPKIQGSRASRSTIQLPGDNQISMLKFIEEIPLFPNYNTISKDDLSSFIDVK